MANQMNEISGIHYLTLQLQFLRNGVFDGVEHKMYNYIAETPLETISMTQTQIQEIVQYYNDNENEIRKELKECFGNETIDYTEFDDANLGKINMVRNYMFSIIF